MQERIGGFIVDEAADKLDGKFEGRAGTTARDYGTVHHDAVGTKARRRANGLEKPSEQRKREKAAAVKRHHKKLGRESKQIKEFHDNR